MSTLNEADTVGEFLAALTSHGFDELIVVDGGSTELDDGLRAARSELVVFLHADTVLPAVTRDALSAAFADPSVIGGAFRLRFDDPRFWFRFYAWWTRFDSAVTTFGDQAIFCRRQSLVDVGGLPHWPILEDVELRRRLRASGRFLKLPLAVTTSVRRFRRHGVVCQQLLNRTSTLGPFEKDTTPNLRSFLAAVEAAAWPFEKSLATKVRTFSCRGNSDRFAALEIDRAIPRWRRCAQAGHGS